MIKGGAAHQEFQEKLYRDLVDLYRTLGIDVFRMPWRMSHRPTRQLDEFTFLYGDPEGDHTVYRYDPQSGDFGQVHSSSQDEPDVDAFERQVAQQERALAEGSLAQLELGAEHPDVCQRYGREFFVVYNGGSIGVGPSTERMMLLALAPEAMRRQMLVQAAYAVAYAKQLALTAWPRVMIGGMDLAGNGGPMYSPGQFRQVTLPAYKHLMEQLVPLGLHYVFRSDGVLWPVADMLFAEAGIDGYGEVDREVGMTVAAVRERYPRVAIWGNFSSSFLMRASAAQVREEAQKIVEESGGTRYFHGCSNAILNGTPVENVLALFSV